MKHIENLETMLSEHYIGDAIIELDNFIGEVCQYGDEMDKLSEPQKCFYCNQAFEKELNNGGFNQFFYNSSGDLAHQTIESLLAINAHATANLLQLAIEQFPNKIAPSNRSERQDILEQIEDAADSVWSELDEKFYEYADNLTLLNLEFVRKNRNSF